MTRRSSATLVAGATWLAVLSAAAQHEPPARPRASAPSDHLEGALGFGSPTDPSVPALARLGRSGSPADARRLLDWAADPTLYDDPELTLSLVRALDQHLHGPLADEVVTRLLAILRRQPGARPSSPEKTSELERVARGSAARALALSGHPRAERFLASLRSATADDETATLALATTGEKPPSSSPAPPAPPAPHVAELDQAGPTERAFDSLLRFVEAGAPSADTARQAWFAEWEPALAGPRPVFALRAAVLLAPRLPDLGQQALATAERHLESSEPLLHATAAWTFAALAPERALDWSNGKDALRRAAAQRQIHTGPLERRCAELLRATPPTATDARSPLGACWPLERPPLGPRLLFELESEEPLLWAAPLVSWLRLPREAGAGPDAAWALDHLSEASPAKRAALAYGLGRAEPGRALALLAHAYQFEVHAGVRLAQVIALARQARSAGNDSGASRLLDEIARLDPDVDCRAAARGEPEKMRHVDYVAVLAPDGTLLQTLEGRVLVLPADPDGFAATTGQPFAPRSP
ncbi:MAG TPA: hypothetical protein VLC09_07000 [Polyangiaceae bacterium]|nr:hypothetical protein [Polyangiaceae bacterium]